MKHPNDYDPVANSEEYRFGYDLIRYAMTQFNEPDLQFLRNALYKASSFVNDELEEMEDETKELGLDKWLEHEKEEQLREEEERQEWEELEGEQENEEEELADA